MSDDDRRRSGSQEFDEGWAEPGEEPGLWRRVTRDGIQRVSTRWMIVLCATVLVILTGVVLGNQARQDARTPQGMAVTDQPLADLGIEFSPIAADPTAVVAVTDSPAPGATSPAPVTPTSAAAKPSPAVSPSARPPSPKPSPAPPKVTFQAVGGYGCSTANTGYYAHDRDPGAGWGASDHGGWGSNGCSGTFDSMPMSGSDTVEDPTQYADWSFTVGSASRSCDLSTYVPVYGGDAKRAGGNPAQYRVGDGQGSSSKGTFTVDQPANGGRWISIKTYPVSGGKLWIRVLNRGIDWGAREGYRIGLAQFKVVCH
ncbi:hypothetical protein F4553_007645 [Allocatelliglobosispora scoriae]|uniref:Adhesin n=1 Tax=Allocatelliglobosispora scoriae TaxID=643052 RepID=A0A841C5Y3_9ACTN|nr:hypothetical protein [Allocatelliglobosispora scoriae]MBB5874211.1 hypothetical protein [Allocatelliglobosispora scoriae]